MLNLRIAWRMFRWLRMQWRVFPLWLRIQWHSAVESAKALSTGKWGTDCTDCEDLPPFRECYCDGCIAVSMEDPDDWRYLQKALAARARGTMVGWQWPFSFPWTR